MGDLQNVRLVIRAEKVEERSVDRETEGRFLWERVEEVC